MNTILSCKLTVCSLIYKQLLGADCEGNEYTFCYAWRYGNDACAFLSALIKKGLQRDI